MGSTWRGGRSGGYKEADATVIDITLFATASSGPLMLSTSHATSRSYRGTRRVPRTRVELDRTEEQNWPATVVLAGTTGEGSACQRSIDVPAYIAEHHLAAYQPPVNQ